MMPDRQCCQTPGDKTTLRATTGLISNYVTQSSGCGGVECPWVLKISPGKIFNLSLFDFGTFNVVSVSVFLIILHTTRVAYCAACQLHTVVKKHLLSITIFILILCNDHGFLITVCLKEFVVVHGNKILVQNNQH